MGARGKGALGGGPWWGGVWAPAHISGFRSPKRECQGGGGESPSPPPRDGRPKKTPLAHRRAPGGLRPWERGFRLIFPKGGKASGGPGGALEPCHGGRKNPVGGENPGQAPLLSGEAVFGAPRPPWPGEKTASPEILGPGGRRGSRPRGDKLLAGPLSPAAGRRAPNQRIVPKGGNRGRQWPFGGEKPQKRGPSAQGGPGNRGKTPPPNLPNPSRGSLDSSPGGEGPSSPGGVLGGKSFWESPLKPPGRASGGRVSPFGRPRPAPPRGGLGSRATPPRAPRPSKGSPEGPPGGGKNDGQFGQAPKPSGWRRFPGGPPRGPWVRSCRPHVQPEGPPPRG